MLRKETLHNIETLIEKLTWQKKNSKNHKEKFKLTARIKQLKLLTKNN
ncbi:hypothetical protein [Orenia marismortui]|nr:hypothetical protein [Orenia marismortui]